MNTAITAESIPATIRDNVKGSAMVSIITRTEPDMRKTGNPYAGNVWKTQTLNGNVGFDYENAVNAHARKEGLYDQRQAKPRKWGTLTADRLFVCGKNDGIETHLQMSVRNSKDITYTRKDTGEVVDVETLRPFMSAKSTSITQMGIENEVIVRDITLSNILELRAFGNVYTIAPELPVIAPESEKTAAPVLEPA